jgi:hypothetical protein
MTFNGSPPIPRRWFGIATSRQPSRDDKRPPAWTNGSFEQNREIAAPGTLPWRLRGSALPASTHDKDTLTSEKFRVLLG